MAESLRRVGGDDEALCHAATLLEDAAATVRATYADPAEADLEQRTPETTPENDARAVARRAGPPKDGGRHTSGGGLGRQEAP